MTPRNLLDFELIFLLRTVEKETFGYCLGLKNCYLNGHTDTWNPSNTVFGTDKFQSVGNDKMETFCIYQKIYIEHLSFCLHG